MILDDILARTRADLPARQQRRPLAELEAAARGLPPVRSLRSALRRPGRVTAISEFKRRSPSLGWIREGADVGTTVASYAAAGAAALSVLTDEPFFGGTLADLVRARAVVDLPILRKDFIVDAYQIAEARVAGADAVLLIVAALDDHELADFRALGAELGLDVLVEAHDEREVERALEAGADLVGVNQRDLVTFEVDTARAVRVAPEIPEGVVRVAESGVRGPDDARRLADAGYHAVLVGESVVTDDDRTAAVRSLRAARQDPA